MISSPGCSETSSLSHSSNDSIPDLLGKWKAVGYYSTYFMSSNPSKSWVAYSPNEQFTYEFSAGGKLSVSGKSKGCQYQHYSLSDSTHIQLSSNNCPTEKYSILRLTTDSLYLSRPWYENKYTYVFLKLTK